MATSSAANGNGSSWQPSAAASAMVAAAAKASASKQQWHRLSRRRRKKMAANWRLAMAKLENEINQRQSAYQRGSENKRHRRNSRQTHLLLALAAAQRRRRQKRRQAPALAPLVPGGAAQHYRAGASSCSFVRRLCGARSAAASFAARGSAATLPRHRARRAVISDVFRLSAQAAAIAAKAA